MKKLLVVLAVLGVIVLGIVFWMINVYNSLVSLDVKIDESWGQIQVQYQRRYDLIPNLVEAVKGVANFEKETYEAVTKARSAWAESMNAGSREDQILATQNVESALSRLLVTVENYPQLRAQENFSTLQAQIEGTENRVSVARRDYNESISPFNEMVRSFPALFVAPFLGFAEQKFFGSEEAAAKAPAVDFTN